MALGFYFAPASMSAAQYDDCIKKLIHAGAGHPAGRTYHACFGTADNVQVFDVWTSQAAFDAFGKTLIPILQSIGVDPGKPSVMEIHNVIVPPAAKPRVAQKSVKKSAKKSSTKAAKKAVKKAVKKSAKPAQRRLARRK